MLKKGKQVEVICGNDKGKKGEIIELIKKKDFPEYYHWAFLSSTLVYILLE